MPGYSPKHGWVHGKTVTYKHKPCRCEPCTAANTLTQNLYRLGKRQKILIDARQARKHARWLCAAAPGNLTGSLAHKTRWTHRSLAEHVKMDNANFGRFIRGESKRISADVAERILATPDRRFFLSLQKQSA